MQKLIRKHLWIAGRVQGVFFRDWTRQNARKRGVCGWVKNRTDGRVEAILEGEESAVLAVLHDCHAGPDFARVDEVLIEDEEHVGDLSDFSICYDE